MERYRVSSKSKEPLLNFVYDAIEQAGATILSRADPTSAPFQITVRTPKGEALRLVCYAFLANKYQQAGRPSDEHRFQIKYGSDFSRYHRIYLPAEDDQVTLMFGVHLEEGVIVAIDPAMHAVTWFSRSVEFKDHAVAKIKELGFVGWERDRREGRRKQAKPQENLQTEVLLGLTPEHFLKYVQLERIPADMDPGERLLFIDRLAGEAQDLRHALEVEFDLPAIEILNLIDRHFRLKVAVRGSAAERHLETQLRATPGITEVVKLDEDGKPDFDVEYRRRGRALLECKNILRRVTKSGPRVDFQKTRASKSDPCSRYYKASDFDVLAACLHPFSGKWEYRFRWTRTIEAHQKCADHLTDKVPVGSNGADWTSDIAELLEAIVLGTGRSAR